MTRRKILIVDDDSDLRRGLSIRLKANGYETLFAGDGLTATATAVKEKPDLILLDLGLPAGDGYVVMSRLRELPALTSIPIVVLTARTGRPHREKALAAGARAFLEKPVDNETLIEAIRAALDDPAAEA